MFRFLARQPKPIGFVESLVLLAIIGWLDFLTGHQVTLVIFYCVPIAFAVWLCEKKSAYLVAGLAGMVWWWADVAVGLPHLSPVLQAWEISVRFAFFFLVALAGIALKAQDQAVKARLDLLEHSRKLEQQIIEVSEYEQQRIGRDLHDGLCQYLAAIGCVATSLKMDLERLDLGELVATAAEVEHLLGEAVIQARNLARGLIPVQTDEAGLPAALQELAASTSRLLGIECTFESAGNHRTTRDGEATHLYRIAQEAVNNATKHGRAHNIQVRLSANSSVMSLSVADDGIGFSKTEKNINGLGMSIMQYRSNAVGGEFEIEERTSGGTVVSCTVPAGGSR
jgi:signal transduction histidine kinase